MAADPRQHVLGLDRLDRILVVADLVVDAPDLVGLAVHQDRRPGVGRRVEPGQALDAAFGGLLDIDDHVAAFVLHALELQAELLAHRAAAAVASDEPIGPHAVLRAVWAFDGRFNRVDASLQPDQLAGPGQFDPTACCLPGVVGDLLDTVLLQVEHRCESLARVAGHSKVQHFGVAEIAAPAGPGQAFVDQRPVGADPGQDLLRPARDADRPAAAAVARVGFDHQRAHAVVSEQRGQRQADRPAAGDQYRHLLRPSTGQARLRHGLL